MNNKTFKWIVCLCVMSTIWLVYAILAATFTYNSAFQPNQIMCIVSAIYLFIVLLVIMVGNISKVRMLMFMTSLYSIGVCIRSVFGVLISILVVDKPENKLWFAILDVLALPFTGFYYIASLLTSHFVTEMYWLGLVCVSIIILCLSLVGFMAVTGRNKKIQYNNKRQYKNKQYIHDMIKLKEQQIEENNKFLEKISYGDKKD